MSSTVTAPIKRKRARQRIVPLLFRAGCFDTLHALWGPDRLTVLAYHRVTDPNASDFVGYRPNVSATPAAFAAQLDYLRARFNVISLPDLVAWLRDSRPLPPRPALITFDDGYADNFHYALPALRTRNLPAVLFVATGCIGNSRPFYWDRVAYCFEQTPLTETVLPGLGLQAWPDKNGRNGMMDAWIAYLKTLAEDERQAAVACLPDLLQVNLPSDTFASTHLMWEQIRSMITGGFEMGAHTHNHPILTRIPLTQAEHEIVISKERLESETGRPITAFAYPNGQPTDFNAELQTILARQGFAASFTLLSGPTRPAELRRAPLAIRRIPINLSDTLPHFAARVMGLPRLLGHL